MKRAKVPSVVRVGPHPFTVVWARAAEMHREGIELNGDCDYDRLQIRLRRGLRRAKTREILLHECLHAMHLVCGVADKNPRTDEQWIDGTVHALLQVIRDNPVLYAFLTSE